MSLIFEKFETVQDAASFIARVQEDYPELQCQLFTDSTSAYEHDATPWMQEPIIVHVDRVPEWLAADVEKTEQEIERLADAFTGAFVGT